MRTTIFPILLPVLLLNSPPAGAEGETPAELDPIVVVASKTPRALSDVAGQVSVIRAADIQNGLIEDLDDLFRYEPGLEAETSGTRFGMGGINIRGIGGNRVAIEVDGVPVRDGFAVGSYSNGGRTLVETERVKRLEILHGPASTLYGSDALGGVLAFTTWDPDDLTALGNGSRYLGARGGYRAADDSHVAAAQAALTAGGHGLLATAALRRGHERESSAVASSERDRQDWDSASYAARYTLDTAAGNRLRISATQFDRTTRTDLTSILGFARFRSTTGLQGDDRDEHTQVLTDYAFAGHGIDQGVARVFFTRTRTRQLSLEERAAASVPVRMERFFQYETDMAGVELNLFRGVEFGSSRHHLGAGFEFLRTDSSEFRDGFQEVLATGEVSKTVLGESLPVRDFPNSATDELGVFVQDEIRIGDRWELIPALRYERYELDPRPDAVYLEDNPSSGVVNVDEDRWNPRLGVVWQANEAWSLYGQYVEGFRAPPFADANIGLDIPLFRIRAIPNPDLRSETSRGVELGLRRVTRDARLTLALFETDYDDFIETRALVGVDPETGVLLFQSRNISRARIHGLDLRFRQDLAAWSQRMAGWWLEAAAYWSRGDNQDNGQPLNTVAPPQAIVGLNWTSRDGRLDAGVRGTFTRAQDRIDETDGARYTPAGYGVVDATAGWRVNRHVSLRAGVFNLTDRTHWRWPDVANLVPDDPMIPLLARPGRNYSMSARFEW